MATSGGVIHTPPSGPPPSNVQTAPNLVHFDPKLVTPSQPIYVQRNDYIVFNAVSNGAGVIMRVNYRWLTPEGEIKEGEFDTAPFSVPLLFNFPLYEGWLLSFAARVTTATAAGQWNFLQAFIQRSVTPLIINPTYSLIWQGFVYNLTPNGWPGTPAREVTDGAGSLRSITGTTPAAGADINEVVPTQRRWTLLSFKAQLTTSAAVANRNAGIILDDGANQFYGIHSSTPQPASGTFFYQAVPGQPFFNDTLNAFIIPLPTVVQLKTGFRIKTATSGIQAGDQWSAPQYLVAEWGTWDV